MPAIEFVQGSTNFAMYTFHWERFSKHKKGYYSDTNLARELKFSVKVQVIITVSVVIFSKGFRLKFAHKIEKRPYTHFLTK